MHAQYWWHEMWGFDLLFGFFGCLLLIGFAKGVLRQLIQVKEDYYGEPAEDYVDLNKNKGNEGGERND